jgi:hypothetical protein
LVDFVATQGLLPHFRELVAEPFIPEQLASRIRNHNYQCLRLTGEMLALVDAFDQQHIPTIPFKGPLLAVQLYGDAASRSYCDLDFVVRAEHAEQALALLVARGYEPPPDVRRVPFYWWQRWMDQCRLVRDGIVVELHWALDQRWLLPWDLDAAWGGLEPVRLGGRIVYTFSREHLALYLAAHGAKHAWARLAWILDFGQLVEATPEIEWARVASVARARGVERALLLALRLAHELLGITPPAGLAARVAQDRRVGALAHRVEAALYGGGPSGQRTRGLQRFHSQVQKRIRDRARYVWFHLQVQERVRDRARYLSKLLFASGPHDWSLIRLPSGLAWLYVLIRPLRLAAWVVGTALDQFECWTGV